MKPELKAELNKICEEFTISRENLSQISDAFYRDMNEKTMLKMLKSYITVSDEKLIPNEYLAIDIGGSNIRIAKFSIEENDVIFKKIIKFPLRTRFRNYTSNKYSLKDLIIKALKKIKPYISRSKMYFLAVTVSFGIDSKSKTEANIVELSKGFKLKETINRNIYEILMQAIFSAKLNIVPMAIINDCVATLVTGRFYDKTVDIALIVGTGHNASFINSEKEVINIESANFNKNIPLTTFDNKYLEKISGEANKLFEVLIGGKYIGKIADEIIKDLIKRKLLNKCVEINTKVLVSCVNEDKDFLLPEEQREVIKTVGELLFTRAAKLIVAEVYAIIKYIDKDLVNEHTLIFDGSVYEKCDFFKEEISREINEVFGENASKINHKLIKDASIIGPVIVEASE